jgi:hypothetical protein
MVDGIIGVAGGAVGHSHGRGYITVSAVRYPAQAGKLLIDVAQYRIIVRDVRSAAGAS